MSQPVERTSLDLRYQGYRLRNDAAEARLLASIAQRDIEQPLTGVDTPRGRLLLDGFKRYRCATKLGIECVPYVSLGEGEAQGIAALIGATQQKPLTILEQARFVVQLLSMHDMTIAEVAETLSRSKAWVSMRRRLLEEMSPTVQAILFRGQFPVYSYMATLRAFMRMNGVGQKQIERFVEALAGHRLSVRQIELLAHGYFRGPASLRQAVDQGKWKWSLEQMESVPEGDGNCNQVERALLGELQRLLKSMGRVMVHCDSPHLQNRAFYAQANLLLAGLLSRRESFFNKMEEFYDRTGRAECHLSVTSSGDVAAGDQLPPACQPQCGATNCQGAGKARSATAQGQEAH